MIRSLAPAAVVLLALAAPVAHPQESRMDADRGWDAVTRCAREDSPRARHECLDRVLAEAGLLTDEMRAQQQRRAFGLENAPPAPPAARASAPAPSPAPAPAPAATPAPATATPASPDRLEVEIASAQRAGNARLVLTTTEGAVWRQVESVDMPIPPSAGERMGIRRGVAGGYRCTMARTNLTFRCERTR